MSRLRCLWLPLLLLPLAAAFVPAPRGLLPSRCALRSRSPARLSQALTPRLALRDGRDPGPASRVLTTVVNFVGRNAGVAVGAGLFYLLFTGQIFTLLSLMFWTALVLPLATVAFSQLYQLVNGLTADCPECGTTLKGQKNSLVRCANCGSVLRSNDVSYETVQPTSVGGPESIFETLFGPGMFSSFSSAGGAGPQRGAPQSFQQPGGAPRVEVQEPVRRPTSQPKKKSAFDEEEGEVVDVEVK